MYLNHHYTQYTSLSLMKKPEVQELFQNKLPQEAAKYPCLMHGLMALSALHVAHRLPPEKGIWIPIAFRHQARALAGLRSSLPNLDEQNCHALFALSCMVFTTSISMSSGSDVLHPNESIPTEDLIEPLLLVLGIEQVADAGMRWIQKGMMAPTLASYEVEGSTSISLPPPIENQLLHISSMIETETTDSTDAMSLLGALNALKAVYKDVFHTMGSEYLNPGFVWKWPNRLGSSYVALLRKSDSSALVIYAHFALLSNLLHEEWYFEGWAERVVFGVSRVVEPRWKEVMEWPRQQLAEGLCQFRHEGKMKMNEHWSCDIIDRIDELADQRQAIGLDSHSVSVVRVRPSAYLDPTESVH
jgi:Fungal specific transcription factor domain